MDQREFKLFFKNKSPLLYTYLLENVISAPVSEALLLNIFARFYRTRKNIPASLSREKWLILITKKFLVEYYSWRTTEEGQKLNDSGLTSYQCSHLHPGHQSQLVEWINSNSEEDQVTIKANIIEDLPPAEIRFDVMDRIRTKIKQVEEKYGTKTQK